MKQEQIIYNIFSNIPLDIEGSNLEQTGWMPSEKDKQYMGDQNYQWLLEKYKKRNDKVLFKNVSLLWDSCDFDYSDGSYVYAMTITNGEKKYIVDFEDDDQLWFEGNGKRVLIPVAGATIYDFIRACELCEIELEFSDYALSLLK